MCAVLAHGPYTGCRAKVRSKEFSGQTSGVAAGFVQCNFVAIPKAWAFDFLVFCLRNPKPCPLVEGIIFSPKYNDEAVILDM